jgi:hypothetical protein
MFSHILLNQYSAHKDTMSPRNVQDKLKSPWVGYSYQSIIYFILFIALNLSTKAKSPGAKMIYSRPSLHITNTIQSYKTDILN